MFCRERMSSPCDILRSVCSLQRFPRIFSPFMRRRREYEYLYYELLYGAHHHILNVWYTLY